jgi:hypothetical protein
MVRIDSEDVIVKHYTAICTRGYIHVEKAWEPQRVRSEHVDHPRTSQRGADCALRAIVAPSRRYTALMTGSRYSTATP